MSNFRAQIVKSLGLILASTFIVSCGGKGYDNTSLSSEDSTTGYKNPQGIDYTVGSDDRIILEKRLIAPLDPKNPTPQESQTLKFNQSFKDFVFLRYDKNSEKPSRLGKDSFSLQVLIDNNRWINFQGKLSGSDPTKRVLDATNSLEDSSYSISGEIDDFKDHVIGRLVITQGERSTTVLYRAYEAEVRVSTPTDKNLDEHQNLKRKITDLESFSFAWVNTFLVPEGVATYDVAFVNQTAQASPNTNSNPLEFRGESLNTGVIEEVKVNIKENVQDQDLESIVLIGNAEAEDSKIFALKMKDDKGESTEVMVDIERRKSAEEIEKEKKREEELIKQLHEPVVEENEDNQEPVETQPEDSKNVQAKPAVVEEPTSPSPAPEQPKTVVDTTKPQDVKQNDPFGSDDISIEDIPVPKPRPDYVPPKAPAAKNPAPSAPAREGKAPATGSLGNNSKSYLVVSSGSNALKIVKDFETNFALRGVQNEINKIKKSNGEVRKLKAFFKYANPFRGMIEKIAKAYLIPPQYAYVTVIESAYFIGGKYEVQVAKGAENSTGPFQIKSETGAWLGMKVIHNAFRVMPGPSDERRYFAPSACAAAEYFKRNTKMFHRDTSLAILAYNRGEGNALKLAKQYGYKYSQIAKNNVRGVSYANKKLAYYFIAGAYKGSSFDVDSQSPKHLPRSTVFPPNQMKDRTCRSLF